MNIRGLFETRRLEVFLASSTTLFGAWLLMPWDAMATSTFDMILSAAPEKVWGLVFLLNGLGHMFALAINGRRWWTPFARWIASLISGLVYLAFCIGFILQSWETTAVPVYFSMACGFVICLYFAWRDARLALEVRRHVANA